MSRYLCVCLMCLSCLYARAVGAEPRILTIDLGFDGLLGQTSLQGRNDAGDTLVSSVAGPQSLLLSRSVERQVVPIVCPGSATTAAKAINARRHVVGFCDTPGGGQSGPRGFLRLPSGAFTIIMRPGSVSTEALGINDRDIVVGDFRDSAGIFHGFMWVRGSFTVMDAPLLGIEGTVLVSINNLMHIVGFALLPGGHTLGFRLDNGFYTVLEVPGGTDVLPLAINDSGVIVGVYIDASDGSIRSFLLDGAGVHGIEVPDPSVVMTDIASITNTDVLVGRTLAPSATQGEFLSRGVVLSGLTWPMLLAPPGLRLQPGTADPRRWCGPLGAAKVRDLQAVCPEH